MCDPLQDRIILRRELLLQVCFEAFPGSVGEPILVRRLDILQRHRYCTHHAFSSHLEFIVILILVRIIFFVAGEWWGTGSGSIAGSAPSSPSRRAWSIRGTE